MSLILISMAILILILISAYLYYENKVLQISNYQITNNKIPIEFNNYKIVHISDFHNEKSKVLTEDLVKSIKTIKPKLIVITGDIIDCRTTDINTSINFVKKIIKFAPVYYVPGNHEAKINEYNKLKSELLNLNVKVLENKIEKIKIKDACIEILGIKDPMFLVNSDSYEDNNRDKEIINNEISSLGHNYNNFTILLTHRPEHFDTYVEKKINLAFAGHAHGGQIRVPFVGGLYAPNQGTFPKYTAGTHEKDDTAMIISRGIGNSRFPFRVNNRTELVVATLKRGLN